MRDSHKKGRLSAALVHSDCDNNDRDDDRKSNGYQRNDRKDFAQHAADADVLLIRVLNAGGLLGKIFTIIALISIAISIIITIIVVAVGVSQSGG